MSDNCRTGFRFSLAFALPLLILPLVCVAQVSLPLPTPGERRVREALDQVIELDLEDRRLADLVAELKQRYDLQIQLDLRALEDSGQSADLEVCLGGRGISLRSALRLALDEYDLACVVCDGYLLVTTATESQNRTEARVYPVGDLVTNTGEFTPAPADDDADDSAPGSYLSRVNFSSLTVLIQSIVSPDCWGDGNGPPRPQGFTPSRAITFPQTAEIHDEAEELLTALRAVRERQRAAAAIRDVAQLQPEQDKSGMTLKVYSPGGVPWNLRTRGLIGVTNQAATRAVEQELESLATVLSEFVAPATWQAAGGKGVIRVFQGSLLIQQTENAHREIAKLLPQIASLWRLSAANLPPRLMPRPKWPSTPEPQPRGCVVAIEKALRGVVDLDFGDATLDDLVAWLRESQRIDARLDRRALEDIGLGHDARISCHAKDLELAEGLGLLLNFHDLTFAVRHEVLFITSKIEAENMLITRVYPVFDLVAPVEETSGQDLFQSPNYRSLHEQLRINIDSAFHDGGPGVIEEFAPCGALVVSQTWQNHRRIERFLEALRRARKLATEKGEFQ